MICQALFALWALFSTSEVYLEKDQALDLVLGKDCEQKYEPQKIDATLAEEIDNLGLSPDPESDTAYFFRCIKDGKPSAYALIDNEVGKHLPITYIVGISPDGKITNVEIMVFREVQGWQVKQPKFLKQFQGKDASQNLEVGETIDNVSGATLSAQSITKGVSRALFLWKHFYGNPKV